MRAPGQSKMGLSTSRHVYNSVHKGAPVTAVRLQDGWAHAALQKTCSMPSRQVFLMKRGDCFIGVVDARVPENNPKTDAPFQAQSRSQLPFHRLSLTIHNQDIHAAHCTWRLAGPSPLDSLLVSREKGQASHHRHKHAAGSSGASIRCTRQAKAPRTVYQISAVDFQLDHPPLPK